MEIRRKVDNTESVYEIQYDEQQIKNLINEIIKDCSIRRTETHCIEARYEKDLLEKINSTVFWENIPVYENIRKIKEEPINDPFDYWRRGDPVPYSFESDTLNVPGLVSFLINLLEDKEVDYDWFVERRELSYKKELLKELEDLDKEINKVSNYDTKEKIRMLENLARQVKYINSIPDYDMEKLNYYYSLAESYIRLELVQQIIRYRK